MTNDNLREKLLRLSGCPGLAEHLKQTREKEFETINMRPLHHEYARKCEEAQFLTLPKILAGLAFLLAAFSITVIVTAWYDFKKEQTLQRQQPTGCSDKFLI